MRQPKIDDVATPAVVSLVKAYLMARAYAETMREQVGAVHAEILRECPIVADLHTKTDHWREGEPLPSWAGKPITDSKNLYLSTDELACADFSAEADKRLRKCGLKPAGMDADHCPALVAENLQCRAERWLLNEAGKPFGLDADKLLCGGLDAWRKFLDLTVGLVVSQPGFKCELRRAA